MEGFGPLAQVFGPVGAVIVLGALLYLRERRNGHAARPDDATERREARLLDVIERHAGATEKLATALSAQDIVRRAEHTEQMVTLERIDRMSSQTGHDVRNVLAHVTRPQ